MRLRFVKLAACLATVGVLVGNSRAGDLDPDCVRDGIEQATEASSLAQRPRVRIRGPQHRPDLPKEHQRALAQALGAKPARTDVEIPKPEIYREISGMVLSEPIGDVRIKVEITPDDPQLATSVISYTDSRTGVRLPDKNINRRLETDPLGNRTLVLASSDLEASAVAPDGSLVRFPRQVKSENVPSLTTDGIPLSLYVTLKELKALGCPYGGLSRISVRSITNAELFLQLHVAKMHWAAANHGRLPNPNVLGDLALNLPAFRYVRTIAVQSGHRITRANLDGQRVETRIDTLINNASPEVRTRLRDLMRENNLSPETRITTISSLSLELAPWQN